MTTTTQATGTLRSTSWTEEPFAEVDITTDDALHAAYLERIPVVALDGTELFDFFVDEPALRDLLDRVNRR